jgi:hypothetical protein
VDYLPWLNVKLGLQYTAYTKFNGASNNYDAWANLADTPGVFKLALCHSVKGPEAGS